MNFNDLTVKLTSNENYQSLQPNKQEQIKALIKGYESYAQNITQSFYDNIAKTKKETQDKIKNEQTWGTILNFATLGTYPKVKGIVNGLIDFVTGEVNIGTQLVNNIGQVFAQDGRFGGGSDGFFKELGSDLLYTIVDPLISVAESLVKGGGSVANIFGWGDTEFNSFLDSTTKAGTDIRDSILTFGEKEKDSFGDSFGFSSGLKFLNNTPDKDKVSRIEEHTWDWTRNFSTTVAQGGSWFKDNVSPVIGKIVNPLGIAIDNLGQNSAGEFFSGTMESIGRMIPSIVASCFGDSPALASAVSQIYFFSSSFGDGFSEAIARGATLEEAYTYGYGTAAVETLTEQIGGVQIGKLLPGSVATKVATSKLGKVLQHPVMRIIKTGIDEGMEEVMSEAMSAGLESIISDDPVSNKDFMSRAMSAFLGGAISGGVFGGVGYYAHQKSTVGKVNSLNNEIKRIYEGQNQDHGKAQQVFNRKVDRLLNSYNKDSVLDNNIFEMVDENGENITNNEEGKRTKESRIQAKKDLLEKSGFASVLIEFNEENQNFQLTKKGIEMTTNLEGYMGDSNKNAYSSTLYGLEDTLATKVTNQELTSEQQDVMKLSKKLGSDVVYYTDSDTSINSFFKDGIVYLNTESKKSSLTNFTHELTHSLEGTKQYDTLKNFIMEISETNETLKAKMGELGITKESIIKDYWNQISKLNNIESKAYLMASEYVAFAMSEVVLKDKASIESLTKNKTIGHKILNWIKEKIADVKIPKTDIEKAFLKDLNQAKDLYEEALGLGYRKGLNISEVDKRFSITKDSQGNELSKQQQEFFKDSKVVDEDGNLLVVYHGTTWNFNIFDKARTNVENDFGQGFYFTNADYDAENNYSSEEGIDLSNKIERLTEQIESIDGVDEEVAFERARAILLGSENKVLEVFLNITNPATNDTILIDKESFLENYNEEDFESYEEYEEQVESEFQDFLEETIYNIERILDFELDSRSNKNLKKLIYELSYENFSLYDVKKYTNRLYEFYDGEGNLATNEIVRALVESLGYDGIIDDRVSMKFKGMGLGSDAVHYIVFNSNQIKNTDNLKPTNNPDIRFSKTTDSEGRKLTVEQEKYFKDSKVRDAKGGLQVVYHGTNSKFNEFVFSKINKSNPKLKGFWFINNKQNAYQYGNNIKEGYVNITKPLSLEDKHINKEQYTNFLEYVFNNDGENKALIQQKDFKENISELYDSIENDYELINYIQRMYNEDSKISRFNEILKEKTGYDGTIFEDGGNTIAISLSPNQFKVVDNLTPTSDGDIRYSRDLNKGVKTETEIPFMEKNINESYKNFSKKQFFIDNNLRTKNFNNVFSKKKDISKRKNGKKIVAILDKLEKDYGYIIRKQDRRGELYNHLFNNVLEQIVVELDSNFGENGFNNKEQIINNIERVISNTMVYLDNTFNNNELNISTNNPQGFQYTRGFNWAMREFNVENKDMGLIKKGVGNIVNLIDAVINLDLTDNKSIDMFMAGIGNFRNATHVEQRNSLAIETSGNRVQTLPNVLRQNSVHIDALTKINGNYTKGSGGKNVYNKGLLGYDFMKGLNNPLLDMYAFGNIFGMGMEKSLGNVITKQLENATIKQLTVTNRFNEFFEKDGFIKKNTDNFNRIESEVVEVSNLIDKNGEKIFIPKSQVMTLRNIMLREIVRNRLIESGIRGGELSNKFNKDMIVYFNGNSDNLLKNKKRRRNFKIKDTFDLFNELDNIVNNDSFMSKYNKKLLSFFDTMYEYENNANKDLRGRELTNDKVFIENLSEQERIALKQGLNDNVDVSLIYVPMTSLNESGQSGSGAFDINRVIDLGIDDGMVMGIQENENPSLIDSVNIVVSKYAKSVSNFYGLYRITEDLNLLFNKEIYISPTQKITLKAKVDNLNPNIIKFYETLLRNMSGYQIEKDSLYSKVNKTLGVIKRNFYKATLGANFKVISTQFASLFTTGTMYGDFKGTKKSLTLGMWKNVFAKGSKTKAKYLIENSEIYKDRARNSINEVSEAQSSKFNRGRFNRFTEFTMKGINLTDSMINRALFITLVEHGYSEQQALKMTEQAILRYQSSGLAIGKNSLLRTEHEVVKLLTKFLSEPMKVVSNVIESANKLKVIKNLESNKTNIVSHFENELSNLIKENDKLKNDLSKLDEKVDKELIKELKEEIKFNDDKILDLERYNKTIENQINNVIESKDETKKVFAKRLTGAMLSLLWQTSLGVIFSQLRTGGSDKDEDEETWAYLSKKFGWQLASEFVGYIPIGRDIYSMLIDDFDINVIDEFSAYNDLFSNIRSLYKDVANGNDFDWGKHLRKSIITIGQLTGMPAKNIERVFTTPTKWFSKSLNYSYRDITGQYIGRNELNNAIKNGDEKLIETIINRKMIEKNISLTNATTREINRLAKNDVVVNPSGIPDSFSIDGVEYKNDKDKFAKTYNNATFVVEKIITLNGYKRLDDEYKAKLVKAIFTYYHSLAKQNVSGVQIFTKERTYSLNQAYGYFRDRISYYMNKQQKEKKKKESLIKGSFYFLILLPSLSK